MASHQIYQFVRASSAETGKAGKTRMLQYAILGSIKPRARIPITYTTHRNSGGKDRKIDSGHSVLDPFPLPLYGSEGR
jgi:hypothetical protein